MNWYEHHIRDYDAATSHLSWDEDMAYSRLLRWYYRKEQPIPADVKEACRQVRATTKGQRDAVEAVLREFFTLREDGWHKDTCDEAIAKYQAGEPEREAKKKNEDTRLARHRSERATLFGVINAAGQHLPYNAPIADVRALAARIQGVADSVSGEQPATGTATSEALHATGTATPATHLQRLPNTQPPVPIPHSPSSKVSGKARGTRLPTDWEPGETGFAYALSKGLVNGRAQAELEKFRDHWAADATPKAQKLDWQAAWRTWVRNAIEFATNKRGGSSSSSDDPFAGAH